jgi:hypothetical protein
MLGNKRQFDFKAENLVTCETWKLEIQKHID